MQKIFLTLFFTSFSFVHVAQGLSCTDFLPFPHETKPFSEPRLMGRISDGIWAHSNAGQHAAASFVLVDGANRILFEHQFSLQWGSADAPIRDAFLSQVLPKLGQGEAVRLILTRVDPVAHSLYELNRHDYSTVYGIKFILEQTNFPNLALDYRRINPGQRSFQATDYFMSGRLRGSRGDYDLDFLSANFRRHGHFANGLTQPTIVEAAYRNGIFPWDPAFGAPHLATWFSPPKRGVLVFDKLHVSRSLKKFLKKTPYRVTFNQAYEETVRRIYNEKMRRHRTTWITETLIESLIVLNQRGVTHSVEVWSSDGKLVGGAIGTFSGGYFSGDSIFHTPGYNNSGKVALMALFDRLIQGGHRWIDVQEVTNTTEAFGANYISRDQFNSMRIQAAKEGLLF